MVSFWVYTIRSVTLFHRAVPIRSDAPLFLNTGGVREFRSCVDVKPRSSIFVCHLTCFSDALLSTFILVRTAVEKRESFQEQAVGRRLLTRVVANVLVWLSIIRGAALRLDSNPARSRQARNVGLGWVQTRSANMTRPKIKKQEKETNADLERAEDPELALAEHDSANDANTGNTKMDDEPNEVLRAIRDLKTTMNDRFNILEESLSSTKASVADLSARTHEVEKASSDHENRLSLVETTLAAIRSENNLLRQKVVDLEARSRRQNIKIPVMVDRAHRLGVRAPEAGGRPRVTIARIHSCQTKEKILQLARQGFPLRHNDKPVYIFPDYPAEITKQRQAFVDVRKRLEAGAHGVALSIRPDFECH
ncbi:hypothetical protein WMY93_027018 [Mugilogobius chulae]|uniref:Transposase n=1 Tax=Mugilogobius chulae TaxID=88201 RepID=A0AAW0N0Q3_9GOBI